MGKKRKSQPKFKHFESNPDNTSRNVDPNKNDVGGQIAKDTELPLHNDKDESLQETQLQKSLVMEVDEKDHGNYLAHSSCNPSDRRNLKLMKSEDSLSRSNDKDNFNNSNQRERNRNHNSKDVSKRDNESRFHQQTALRKEHTQLPDYAQEIEKDEGESGHHVGNSSIEGSSRNPTRSYYNEGYNHKYNQPERRSLNSGYSNKSKTHTHEKSNVPQSTPSENWRNKSNIRRSDPGISINRRDWSNEKRDNEYLEFLNKEKNKSTITFEKVVEKEMDLFDMPEEYSLGHCVAEDMRMGSGIAVKFKSQFKQVDNLLNQRAKQGGLAILSSETDKGIRYIYYLVTKKISTGKPTYDTFWSSLQKMRNHIRENNVKKLAIPRIGCGLDRLDWARVKHMIEFLFKDIDVEIIVCCLLLNEDVPTPMKPDIKRQLKVVQDTTSLLTIDVYTIILYFTSEDGHISKLMLELDKKFNFLNNFKRATKQQGGVVRFVSPKNYILYGCVVKATNRDLFDFPSFKKCLIEVNKFNREDKYEYVALEPIDDDEDSLMHEKVLTMLKSYLKQVDIYICLKSVVSDRTWNDRE